MKTALRLTLVALASLWLTAAALADEAIEQFSSVIELSTDGSMLVTETIRVRGEGIKIRRGIYRDFPMVFQNASDQLFCPSCWEEVAFGPQQLGLEAKEVAERVQRALAQVRLSGYEERPPLHMSGGERKRLAIAAALSLQPEVLILDEPTASLDPRSEQLLLEILEALPVTKVLITHDLFFVHRLSRRTVVLHQGRIIRDYTTSEFLADEQLQAVNGLDYTYKNSCYQEIQALQRDRNGA